MSSSILVVDDERNMRFVIGRALAGAGHSIAEAASGDEALAYLTGAVPDLVILDLRMPGMDGLATLTAMKQGHPELPVIMLTAHGNVASAVKAMKAGATEYLTKPFDIEELKLTVAKALKVGSLERQVDFLRGELDRRYDAGIIGASERMTAVLETVEKVAASGATVMIYGESGTGKELVARALHQRSERRAGPFIQLSCAALPETLLESELFGYEKGAFTGADSAKPGRFELADGGSLFLDEIGEISPAVQVKLLRVLEQRSFERLGGSKTLEVDVRLIGATNRDLSQAIRDGSFREDLYYRLNVIPIGMPPLRDRDGDIRLLAEHFLQRYAPGRRFSAEAYRCLDEYGWPGNVRELQNTVERTAILCRDQVIGAAALPAEVRCRGDNGSGAVKLPASGLTLKQVERELIAQALDRTRGNRTRAARLLGISRHTLLYRMEKHGLS